MEAQTTTPRDWQAPAALTIYDVAALERDIGSLDPAAGDWRVDVSAVRELDGAGIQWLLALQARLESIGRRLTLTGGNALVSECLACLGVSHRLSAPGEPCEVSDD
ncbi:MULTISPECIES: STAS domain-containing protein [unclassified Modicisalibacter]|uniref:STAS domain-containing protein n=1 Tax=unclassified Modicisalibacter TaxID=2679913 RepID=UPI001CCD0852|nr:STAS domain-containing protein [Modicisalibacter sp. R2A 31.J]MBZ9575300.1 STAS domain-containing protein [Modicisalibacter sp. MOD 31.J]